MAAVRAEFRGDVLVFAAADPVFGGGPCRVHRLPTRRPRPRPVPRPSPALGQGGPTRPGRVRREDRSAVGSGSARTPLAGSTGCGYGVARGRAVPAALRSGGSAPAARPGRVAGRSRRRSRRRRPGRSAGSGAARCGRRRLGRSVTPTPTPGGPTAAPTSTGSSPVHRTGGAPQTRPIRLGRSTPLLTTGAAVRAAVPRRRADQQAPPPVVMRVVRFLVATGATSLLDFGEEQWRDASRRRGPNDRPLGRCWSTPAASVDDLADARRLGRRVPARRLAAAPARLPGQPRRCDFTASRSPGCASWPNAGCAGGWAPDCTSKPPAADCAP